MVPMSMRPESPYKPFLPPDSTYAAKSCTSHKSEESKSTKLDSEEDEHSNIKIENPLI